MKNITITIIILAIIAIGGYFLLQNQKGYTPDQQTNTLKKESTPITSEEKTTLLIIYTDTGYIPSTLNIKVGETVTFKNNSNQNMWTASAMHPSHIMYSGTSLSEHCPDLNSTSFDACTGTPPGGSWSFKFNKAGTWKYHDHLSASNFGKIVVE